MLSHAAVTQCNTSGCKMFYPLIMAHLHSYISLNLPGRFCFYFISDCSRCSTISALSVHVFSCLIVCLFYCSLNPMVNLPLLVFCSLKCNFHCFRNICLCYSSHLRHRPKHKIFWRVFPESSITPLTIGMKKIFCLISNLFSKLQDLI